MSAATRTVRVVRRTVEAVDICSFELVDPDGAALPPFSAGAHIDVHVDGGPIRQYSLCNDSTQTHRYLVAVLKDPASRGGSVGMHALVEGQLLQISDPRNHFPLVHDASGHLLVAGGIGITPLLCMVERLANTGASFSMHYCTRSRERTAFFERIGASSFAGRVQFHFDDGPPLQKFDAAAVLSKVAPGTHLYVCGPTGFMDWVLDAARSAGWPEDVLHREYFAAAPLDTSSDGSFEVQLASTGQVITVSAQQSVVAALAAHGVDVPVSCEQGVCGTCVTRVTSGTPDHRDMFFTPEEQARNDQFTPCCSRSLSARLVLDL
jgi:vanillate monooxygenase ferredoxin subunit